MSLSDVRAHLDCLERRCFRLVSPSDFVSSLYGKGSRFLVSTSTTESEKGTYKAYDFDDGLEFIGTRANAYIYPVSFFGHCPKGDLVKDLLAFVVDMDDVELAGLENLLDEFDRCPEMAPTHIVRTGGGYHLWYLLVDGIQWRKRWNQRLAEVNEGLYRYWSNHAGGCVCDHACRSIPHGFRPPGSLSKDGRTATVCYQVGEGERVSIYDLADALGVSMTYRDGTPIDLSPIDGYDEIAKKAKKTSREIKPNRHPRLYEWTLEQVPKRTMRGNRYLSMFCLAGLAWDCGIPVERLRSDLERLVRDNWTSSANPVRHHEISSAMSGYCPDYASLKKETREELLGWRYGPSPKRNYGAKHKTREEHMTAVNRKRSLAALFAVEEAIAANPSASKKQIAADAGVSYPTVLKYYQRAMSHYREAGGIS